MVVVSDGVETVIGPETAPEGTVTVSCVALADCTDPLIPLKLTVSGLAVVLNPVP